MAGWGVAMDSDDDLTVGQLRQREREREGEAKWGGGRGGVEAEREGEARWSKKIVVPSSLH